MKPSLTDTPSRPRAPALHELWPMVRDAADRFSLHRAPSMGASLAYYTLFSMAPLLLIAISVAGLFFGAEAARGEIVSQLRGLLGEAGATLVQSLLDSVHQPAHGVIGALGGVALMVFGATTVFAELQATLDIVWEAPPSRLSGIARMLRARVVSFGLILGVGFLLLVSLLAEAALGVMERWWAPLFGWAPLAHAINAALGFTLAMSMFALIYKLMPRVRIAWSDVWVGAATTALLFTLGREAIGWYIGRGAVSSGFGAAGAVVALLVWVYWSAQIFLFGAELTWVWATRFGSRRHAAAKPATPASKGML